MPQTPAIRNGCSCTACKVWQAAHDGRINTLWDAQAERNTHQDKWNDKIDGRMLWMFLTALTGSLAGGAVSSKITWPW